MHRIASIPGGRATRQLLSKRPGNVCSDGESCYFYSAVGTTKQFSPHCIIVTNPIKVQMSLEVTDALFSRNSSLAARCDRTPIELRTYRRAAIILLTISQLGVNTGLLDPARLLRGKYNSLCMPRPSGRADIRALSKIQLPYVRDFSLGSHIGSVFN